MREIYFDNAATTRPFDEVCDTVVATMKNDYGNPSSLHTKGIEAEKIVSGVRTEIAKAIDADSKNVIFMSSGTEANNFAVFNVCRFAANKGKPGQVITTLAEHASILQPLAELKNQGYRIDFASLDGDGLIDMDSLESLISDETALIAVSHVNSETGTVQDIDRICKIRDKKNPGTLILCDCVQSFCKLKLQPGRAGVDFATFSSHKIHGPKGVSAIYVSKRVKAVPRMFGGGQERGLRSGTENVPAIAGFGDAARIMYTSMEKNYLVMNSLKGFFLEQMRLSGLKYRVISNEGSCSPYIVSLGFEGVNAEVLLRFLAQQGIFVSSGSACSSHKKTKSGTLTAMKIPDKYAKGAIRFSFSMHNTKDEIGEAVAALKNILPGLVR